MKQISISKKNLYLAIALLFLITTIIFSFLYLQKLNEIKNLEKDKSIKTYNLLNPNVANQELEEFLTFQKKAIITYSPLKTKLQDILKTKKGKFGVYFEDLTTGSWIGINEKEEYTPASLLKIPTMAAILKMVEEEELKMNTQVKILESDINTKSGTLTEKNIGEEKTIKELLEILIIESDNTANHALFRQIPSERYIEARLSMGMPLKSTITNIDGSSKITPKQYSNIFRSLYISSYLKKPFSQWTLSVLASTEFNEWIVDGVPKGTIVSHKIGLWPTEGSFHDCGIIYTEKTDYMLCIMSKNTTYEESTQTMKELSKEIYNYVLNQ